MISIYTTQSYGNQQMAPWDGRWSEREGPQAAQAGARTLSLNSIASSPPVGREIEGIGFEKGRNSRGAGFV